MAKASKDKSPGLKILGENDDIIDFSNSANDKSPQQNFYRSTSQQSRRTPTPTKQISLTAVKRREDSFYKEDEATIQELKESMKLEAERSFIKEPTNMPDYVVTRNTASSHVTKMEKPTQHDCLHNGHNEEIETAVKKEKDSRAEKPSQSSGDGAKAQPPRKTSKNQKESSSSEDSSDDEEEERKAPNQLLMEFLECIYAKDYPNAAKLCKMILIYEPDHPVALQFKPVIDERIQLDIEAAEEGSDDDDSGEEEDETDDDSDDDDSDESSDSDSDEDDDGDEDNEDQNGENSEEKPEDKSPVTKGPFKV